MKGKFIVISGPSGVGKGTICDRLRKDLNLGYSISMTTRKKREGEVDGKNYYFTTTEDFEKRIMNDEFVEYATYNGNYYGTLKKEVLSKLEQGISIISEIEVKGALQIKKNFSDSILIYILPPSLNELEKRLVLRNTESREEINRRLAIYEEEIKYIDAYDYKIVNDDLETCIQEIEAIIIDKEKMIC